MEGTADVRGEVHVHVENAQPTCVKSGAGDEADVPLAHVLQTIPRLAQANDNVYASSPHPFQKHSQPSRAQCCCLEMPGQSMSVSALDGPGMSCIRSPHLNISPENLPEHNEGYFGGVHACILCEPVKTKDLRNFRIALESLLRAEGVWQDFLDLGDLLISLHGEYHKKRKEAMMQTLPGLQVYAVSKRLCELFTRLDIIHISELLSVVQLCLYDAYREKCLCGTVKGTTGNASKFSRDAAHTMMLSWFDLILSRMRDVFRDIRPPDEYRVFSLCPGMRMRKPLYMMSGGLISAAELYDLVETGSEHEGRAGASRLELRLRRASRLNWQRRFTQYAWTLLMDDIWQDYRTVTRLVARSSKNNGCSQSALAA